MDQALELHALWTRVQEPRQALAQARGEVQSHPPAAAAGPMLGEAAAPPSAPALQPGLAAQLTALGQSPGQATPPPLPLPVGPAAAEPLGQLLAQAEPEAMNAPAGGQQTGLALPPADWQPWGQPPLADAQHIPAAAPAGQPTGGAAQPLMPADLATMLALEQLQGRPHAERQAWLARMSPEDRDLAEQGLAALQAACGRPPT